MKLKFVQYQFPKLKISQELKTKFIAMLLFCLGIKPSVSTSIDEESILCGYGKLDYVFKYSLPNWLIYNLYNSYTWKGAKPRCNYLTSRDIFKLITISYFATIVSYFPSKIHFDLSKIEPFKHFMQSLVVCSTIVLFFVCVYYISRLISFTNNYIYDKIIERRI